MIRRFCYKWTGMGITEFIILSCTFTFLINYQAHAKYFDLSVEMGYSMIGYTEKHELQPAKDVEINERLFATGALVRFYLLGSWLTLVSSIHYTGPVISNDNETYEVAPYTQNNMAVLALNGRPMNLKLTYEYFTHDLGTNSSEFGYEAITGTRLSVILDHDTSFFHFYIKAPYWISVSRRNEYSGGLIFFSSEATKTEMDAPEYRGGTFIKGDYTFIRQDILGVRTIQIRQQIITVSIGYSW